MLSINDIRNQQEKGAADVLSALRSVELNVTEFCNRTCSFCPHSDPLLFPNNKNKMSVEVVEKIVSDLKQISFNGRIGFAGFGEPLAHPMLSKLIGITRQTDAKWIEVVTNGDFLNRKRLEDLANVGCTHVVVSMYDKDITDILTDMATDLPITIIPKHCYEQRFELTIVNRIDNMNLTKHISPIDSQCFLPFYKMFIDWNGDVLVCPNDWGKRSNIGNVMNQSIKDIWLSKNIYHYRSNLQKGERKSCQPCNRCDIQGTKYGRQSFNIFEEVLLT